MQSPDRLKGFKAGETIGASVQTAQLAYAAVNKLRANESAALSEEEWQAFGSYFGTDVSGFQTGRRPISEAISVIDDAIKADENSATKAFLTDLQTMTYADARQKWENFGYTVTREKGTTKTIPGYGTMYVPGQ